jgi:hypothetical protein
MPWTTPETFTAGQTLTAASMNIVSGNAVASGRGILGIATKASNQTGITAQVDITDLSVTFTAVAGQYYTGLVQVSFQSTAGSPVFEQVAFLEGAVSLSSITYNWTLGGNTATVAAWMKPQTFTAGSHTVKIQFGRAGGDAATYQVNSGSWLALFDVGTAA